MTNEIMNLFKKLGLSTEKLTPQRVKNKLERFMAEDELPGLVTAEEETIIGEIIDGVYAFGGAGVEKKKEHIEKPARMIHGNTEKVMRTLFDEKDVWERGRYKTVVAEQTGCKEYSIANMICLAKKDGEKNPFNFKIIEWKDEIDKFLKLEVKEDVK